MNMKPTVVVALSLLLLVAFAAASTTPATSGPPPWSYSHSGTWPELCQKGKEQSPIDFSLREHRGHDARHHIRPPPPFDGEYIDDGTLVPLRLSEGCSVTNGEVGLNILNNGHTLMGTLHPLGGAEAPTCTIANPIDGKIYSFVQMHIHRKAEHLFLGHRLDMEMHLVFSNHQEGTDATQDQLMVLGVPLMLVKDSGHEQGSKLLNLMLTGSGLPAKAMTNVTREPKELKGIEKGDKTFSMQHMLPQNDEGYMAYSGSLTTPPCTEGVHWFVFSHPSFVSAAAIRGYSRVMEQAVRGFSNTGNARPAQAINGRTIRRFLDPTTTARTSEYDEGMNKLSVEAGKEAKKVTLSPAELANRKATKLSDLSTGTILSAFVLLVVAVVIYNRVKSMGTTKTVGVDYSRVNTSLNSNAAAGGYGGTASSSNA